MRYSKKYPTFAFRNCEEKLHSTEIKSTFIHASALSLPNYNNEHYEFDTLISRFTWRSIP